MHIIWTSSEEVRRGKNKKYCIALAVCTCRIQMNIEDSQKSYTAITQSFQKSAKMNSLNICFVVTLTIIFTCPVSSTEIEYSERNDKICNYVVIIHYYYVKIINWITVLSMKMSIILYLSS